jgi:hypothetical protein
MSNRTKSQVTNHDGVLEHLADTLDIPRSKFEEAESRYKSIGAWLDRDGSSLSGYEPMISPQGSFLLGTVTRPWKDTDQYDVDLICVLQATKAQFTQKSLKEAIGNELILYAKANGMKNAPGESRRCWTLEYAKDTQFHMDVLPALPDSQNYLTLMEVRGHTDLAGDEQITRQAIAITDNTLPQYAKQTGDWPQSNPLGYAVWFRNRMLIQLVKQKKAYASRQVITASVDDIPDHEVKTPLQRAIQLLKRHRDIMFGDDDDKPISIIITTLSAHDYDNEPTVSEALQTILRSMDSYITTRDGEALIANPVNPEENFADKWSENPNKRENFYTWLEEARRDFALYLRAS